MESIDAPLESEISENEMLCNWQDRFRHLFIDFIVIGLLAFLFQNFIYKIESALVFYMVLALGFIYYFVSEAVFNTTLGKIVNRTKIVYLKGNSSSLTATIIRTVVRIVPFSFITYFTLYNAPLHDLLSRTYMVRIKKNKK